MLLHLLRHADAGDPLAWNGPDATRPLSDKGRRQADRLGRFLAERGLASDLVVSSPKVRAVGTAELVAAAIGADVVIDDRVAGPLDIAALDRLLAGHGDPERPIVVGHDPDLSALLASLVGAPGIHMRKGTFARLETGRPLRPGMAVLRWLLPPDAVKAGR